MTQQKETSLNLLCRPAAPSEAKQASQLIFDSFPKFATHIFGLGDARQARRIIAKLFSQGGHRFSYEFTHLMTHNNRIVGLFLAYPGNNLRSLNRRFGRLLIKQYTLRGKLGFIRRILPMLFIQEAAGDEYLLSVLAVKKSQRGKGVDAHLLGEVETHARQAGYKKLVVMISIDDQDARHFYERKGFNIKAIHLESNPRVQFLGAGYQRMVKALD